MSIEMLGRIGIGYPLRVRPGQRVSLNKVHFKYWGTTASFYVCWGIKKRGSIFGVDFNNGDGLAGRTFGYAPISVPASSGEIIERAVSAILTIPDMPTGIADTFLWLSKEPSTDESQFLFDRGKGSGAIDTDSGVLDIIASDIPSIPLDISVPWVQVESPIRETRPAGGNFILKFMFDYKGPQANLRWTYELGANGMFGIGFTPESGLLWSGEAGVGPDPNTIRYATDDIRLWLPNIVDRKVYDARIRIFSGNTELKADTDADALTIL